MKIKHATGHGYARGQQERVVQRFLWRPKRLSNETRWLEFAHVRQIKCVTYGGRGGYVIAEYWADIDWADDPTPRGLNGQRPPRRNPPAPPGTTDHVFRA